MIEESTFQSTEDAFGTVRAEWLSDEILFRLFTEPAYFPELKTARPCVLQGGRGTGKTTVLRSLCYQGQFELRGRNPATIRDWPFYGFYYRINTNRVTAFEGPELQSQQWTRVFAHYLNLIFCGQMSEFAIWYETQTGDEVGLSDFDCEVISTALNIERSTSINELHRAIELAKVKFESFLNNLSADTVPGLSLQAQPIDEFCQRLRNCTAFIDKSFFFVIDEFENLLDDQQAVLNTMIKHATAYSFKIGVKELGWRRRSTLNESEQLTSPADYEMIDINEKFDDPTFKSFAEKICNDRLKEMAFAADRDATALHINDLLVDLSMDDEATILGASNIANQVRSSPLLSNAQQKAIQGKSDLELFFIDFWANTKTESLGELADQAIANGRQWRDRYDNYKHAMLFLIRTGKPGIRKYYSGWNTLVLLSGRNIRFILQLINQAVSMHMRDGNGLDECITAETQTLAAQSVGRNNLSELEGLDVNGARLTKLLLSLGRVFEVMAQRVSEKRPEITQFCLPPSAQLDEDVQGLLTAAIMHVALVRNTSNKLSSDSDLRAYDYAVHPIFAPFFVFSHRKKRKFVLDPEQLIGLVRDPAATIRSILKIKDNSENYKLPTQLRLFEDFYASDS